jgi:hypothetical protein
LAGLILATLPQPTDAAAQNNIIQVENEKPGTTDWLLTKIKKGPKPPLYAPEDEPYERGWAPANRDRGLLFSYEHSGGGDVEGVREHRACGPNTRLIFTGWVITGEKAPV